MQALYFAYGSTFAWYKRLMLAGAREHGLPREWLALLEALPERHDPALS